MKRGTGWRMPSTATGQFNDALAASNRSLEIYPGYVNGWINRGQILYNIGYWYEDVAHDTDNCECPVCRTADCI